MLSSAFLQQRRNLFLIYALRCLVTFSVWFWYIQYVYENRVRRSYVTPKYLGFSLNLSISSSKTTKILRALKWLINRYTKPALFADDLVIFSASDNLEKAHYYLYKAFTYLFIVTWDLKIQVNTSKLETCCFTIFHRKNKKSHLNQV